MAPDDRWQDIRQKLDEYFAIGVDRVWVVEPDNRTVLVFSSPTDSRRRKDEHCAIVGFDDPYSVHANREILIKLLPDILPAIVRRHDFGDQLLRGGLAFLRVAGPRARYVR